jgi:hypothetical protein
MVDQRNQTKEKIAGAHLWSCLSFLTKLDTERVVESLQSHLILTMSHWSSGLHVCLLLEGIQVQISGGVLM